MEIKKKKTAQFTYNNKNRYINLRILNTGVTKIGANARMMQKHRH